MLSLVLVVIIVSNIILWSYQMNQFDMDRMQETFSIVNATRMTSSPWVTAHSDFTVNPGTKLSGGWTDTTGLDGGYESFLEAQGGAYSYNPSDYVLGGSTTYVSGSTADLTANDNVYMNFRSYASDSSPTSPTDAFIAYRTSTTSSNAKERTWNGTSMTWSAQNELPTSGSPVRMMRVASCPLESSYEKIVVTASDDGYLDAHVWDGTVWTVTDNIGYVGSTPAWYHSFDIVYEETSGEALLVYAVSSTDTTRDLAYKTWSSGSGWSAEYYIDDTGHTSDIQYRFVELASNPLSGSNEITMVALDYTNSDANGWVWDGTSWGEIYELDNSVSIRTEECIAVAYESKSGTAWTAVGISSPAQRFAMRSQTNGQWSSTRETPSVGGVPNWCTLKSDPESNRLMLVSVDSLSDLNTVYWDGSGAWTVQTEHDNGVDTNAQRCADFAWEPTGSKGLLVYGTQNGQITYKTFTAPDNWASPTNAAMGSTHRWVQLHTNPRNITTDVKILGAVLDSNNDLGAIQWDGSQFTVIGAAVFTSDTGTYSYECFDLKFENFGMPTFTCEVELSGTSNTQDWTRLEWTADLSFTTSDVETRIQLYNYNSSQYPASGDGYMADTIGETNSTKSQQITTTPTHFRDANGNWKIKITGTKTTDAPFELKVDWAELKATTSEVYRLNISNDFETGLSADFRGSLTSFEILIRYNVTENAEKWFLKAYNWNTAGFSDAGFNTTGGSQPALGEWNEYAITVTGNCADYVSDAGIIHIEFFDEGLNTNQTEVGVDFLGVKTLAGGTQLEIKNSSPLTIHVVAVWINDATSHNRYPVNWFLNSGQIANRSVSASLPQEEFIVRIVTERGNVAVFSSG